MAQDNNNKQAVPVVSVVLTPEQVRAMNAIVRSQKRNASASAQELLEKLVNGYIATNFEALVDGVEEAESKRYDAASSMGFKHDKSKDQYVTEQLAASKEILDSVKKLAKK